MIGGGYVGLVSGACFADFGNAVTIVERDLGKLAMLRDNKIPIFEPKLDQVVARNVKAGRLEFTADLNRSIAGADVVFIAVGTPTRRGGGHADLTAVYEAARAVAMAATAPMIVVTKSTVPVGTGREVARILRETRPDIRFDVASNPEFLREGNAINDFMEPDRVVIGIDLRDVASATPAEAAMRRVYAPLVTKGTPFRFVSLESAELTKYASNTFLAMKVAFVNEMADLSEKTGADIAEIAACMGLDRRIGEKFLQAGPGFGGSCFPKDTRALAAIAQDAGVPSRLVEATIAANEYRKEAIARRIVALAGGDIAGKVVALLGLTFKPDTDDMREATSLPVMRNLLTYGARIQAYDPEGMAQAASIMSGEVAFMPSARAAIEGSDILVLLTEWDVFRELSPQDVLSAMHGNIILDMRNLWDGAAFTVAGASYHAVGRPLAGQG